MSSNQNKVINCYRDFENGSTNPNVIYKLLNKKIKLKEIKEILSNINFF